MKAWEERELLRERFKVKKWKWYLVDLRDFYYPVIVRVHLINKEQATWFRDKHYDNSFSQVKLIEERYLAESYIQYTESLNLNRIK